jgi:hypothetical protein
LRPAAHTAAGWRVHHVRRLTVQEVIAKQDEIDDDVYQQERKSIRKNKYACLYADLENTKKRSARLKKIENRF